MSAFGINIRLSAGSSEALGRLSNYSSILEPELLHAMDQSIRLLKEEAASFADSEFQNSTGRFTGSLQISVDNPYQAQLWSEEPYAQRLEYGFSGMTDSLGRFYHLWPGGYRNQYWNGYRWATRTAETNRALIGKVFRVAIDLANLQLGSGTP